MRERVDRAEHMCRLLLEDVRRGGRDVGVELDGRVQREQVREEACGVRRGHRGTGKGSRRGLAADVGRANVQAYAQ